MVKIKKELIIEGKEVHNVGYRLFLMELAEELLITNFSAENNTIDDRQQVIVHIDGEEKKVKEFIKIAKTKHPKNAVVDNDYLKVSDYETDIRTLESFSRSFSASQLSKIATAGVSMLGEQSKTNESINATNKSLTSSINATNESIKATNHSLTASMNATRESLTSSINSFHKDTISRFDTVDEKYGKISSTMGIIVEGMNKRDELFENKFLVIEKNIQKSNHNIEALLQILTTQK